MLPPLVLYLLPLCTAMAVSRYDKALELQALRGGSPSVPLHDQAKSTIWVKAWCPLGPIPKMPPSTCPRAKLLAS